MSSFSFIGPQFVCCDIVSRLSSDVQLLHQELELLRRLQSCYRSLEEQYHCLLDELDVKLATLVMHKEFKVSEGTETPSTHRIEEFMVFVRRVWNNVCHKIERNAKNDVYISFIEGSPFMPIMDQIMDYVYLVSRVYLAYFPHQNCSTMFSELSHQVMDVIYPEMFSSNEFEKSLTFVTNAIPCLINLFTVMDLYTYTPKFDSVATITKEVTEGISLEAWRSVRVTQPTLLPTRYLVALLSGELLGKDKCLDVTPVVEHDSCAMGLWVHQMTQYILQCSVIPKPAPSTLPLMYYKTLPVPYPPVPDYGPPVMSYYQQVAVPQVYRPMDIVSVVDVGMAPGIPLQGVIATKRPRRRNITEEKSKGTKRGLGESQSEIASDLLPIKVPRLSEAFIMPLDY